ncbi:MAG: tetratricopeptide repeat protein [Kiritimatiellae bacterium]|nr:tetratricopeptide repeat protein [Kiritimatiellia bacterium]
MPHNPKQPNLRYTLPALAALLALTVLLFFPVLTYDFIHYDEYGQILQNPLIRSLHPRNVARMFSRFSVSSYYPVRLLSLAFDYAVWGTNPVGYHITSLLLHLANIALVFVLALQVSGARKSRRGDGPAPEAAPRLAGAFVAAMVFAVHPVVVEPVAWVGGREELLMVFFSLLAVLSHMHGRNRAPARLVDPALTAFFCGLACLSNVLGVVVPALIVACDWIVARERGWRRILVGSWYLWAVALAALVLKIVGDRRALGADLYYEGQLLTLPQRVVTILHVYALNIGTVVWPRQLSLIYPEVLAKNLFAPAPLLGAALVGLSLAALWCARRNARLLFGLVWFLLALAPSSQILPHHISRADRFLYLPLIGMGLALGAGVDGLLAVRRRARTGAMAAGMLVLLLAMSARSFLQVRVWRDTEHLFRHVLSIDRTSSESLVNLGISLFRAGKTDQAIARYRQALAIEPNAYLALCNLGDALAAAGKPAEAAGHYRRALEIYANLPEAHAGLGRLLAAQGDAEQALRHFSEAIALQPRGAAATYAGAGAALLALDRPAEAIAVLSTAIELDPAHVAAHGNLANALTRTGRYDEALAHYSDALRLNPALAGVHSSVGHILFSREAYEQAAAHFSRALVLEPDNPDLHTKLGITLTNMGRIREAISHFSRALELDPNAEEARRSLQVLQAR